MLPAIPFLLKALTMAPAVLDAGLGIYNAVTGEELPPDTEPRVLAEKIDALPADQKAQVMLAVIDAQTRAQELDTDRFRLLTDGDADKVRATARPEIARQAMQVVTIFAKIFRALAYATIAEWALRAGFDLAGQTYPVSVSVMSLFAEIAPAAEVIWAPLIASFWICGDVIKKYMGCRERDKAQAFELANGAPLESSQATIAAAGSGLADIIRAFRSK
jgi:hypothetical protein